MGLLERSSQLREEQEHEPSGLLSRALAAREKEESSTPGPVSVERNPATPAGLRARAAVAEQEMEEAEHPAGLLGRAASFQALAQKETAVAEIYDPEPGEPAEQALKGLAPAGLLSRAMALREGEDLLAGESAVDTAFEDSLALKETGKDDSLPAEPTGLLAKASLARSERSMADERQADISLDDELFALPAEDQDLENVEKPADRARTTGLLARASKERAAPLLPEEDLIVLEELGEASPSERVELEADEASGRELQPGLPEQRYDAIPDSELELMLPLEAELPLSLGDDSGQDESQLPPSLELPEPHEMEFSEELPDLLDSDLALAGPGQENIPLSDELQLEQGEPEAELPDSDLSDVDLGLSPELMAEDPFGEWQAEAERETEQSFAVKDKPQEEQKSGLLFAEDSFTTLPDEIHIASQKKIDNYLALFDITKEINTLDSFAELWDTVLYAILGQMGSESIAIFSGGVKSGQKLLAVAHTGFELPEDWTLGPEDEIYKSLQGKGSVRYAGEFFSAPISDKERMILEKSRTSILVPLRNRGQMYGIVLLGQQLSGDDYAVDDLEYLALLGEVAAAGLDRLTARQEFEVSTQDLRRRTDLHQKIFDFSRYSAGARNLDELYDLLSLHLKQDFHVSSFSLILLNPSTQEYKIFGGNQISPDSLERFSLKVSSDLIGMISNVTHIYELGAFRENAEIQRCYTNDDIALMQMYWIIPLINLNWLVGFLTINRLEQMWDSAERELAVTMAEIIAPVFANGIILKERETIFRDPFSPLEERLRMELARSQEFHSGLCLVDIKVKNIKRLLALNSTEDISRFLLDLNASIASFLLETDFVARIGQGRFALLLPGRSADEAGLFLNKLKSELKRIRLLPGSPIEAAYAFKIFSNQDSADAEQLLALLE